jgi:integrase
VLKPVEAIELIESPDIGKACGGSCQLEDVGTKRLEDYLADRLEEVTFASASKELGILKAAYAKAIRWGWTTSNPVTGLSLNQEGEERIRWLTDEEEAERLGACPPWLRYMVSVGLDTGLRRSNLVGLQVGLGAAVDLGAGGEARSWSCLERR